MSRSGLLLVCASLLSVCSCHQSTNAALPSEGGFDNPTQSAQKGLEPQGEFEQAIAAVRVRKDPKGSGWFSPKLRDVYTADSDDPTVFCDSGPEFPTGKWVTIFFVYQKGTPDQTACKKAISVFEGEGYWKDGKAVSRDEMLQSIRKQKQQMQQHH